MATLRGNERPFIRLLTQCRLYRVAELEPELMMPRQGAAVGRGPRTQGHLCTEAGDRRPGSWARGPSKSRGPPF